MAAFHNGHIESGGEAAGKSAYAESMYLDEELGILAQRNPLRPLPKLLGPVFEQNQTKLEKSAPKVAASSGGLGGGWVNEGDFLTFSASTCFFILTRHDDYL
jgi:hypothetical protein